MRLLLAILLCCGCAVSASPREPSAQDYEVWGAVVGSDAQSGTVVVWHRVDPVSVFARGDEKSAIERFPDVRPSAAQWDAEGAELDLERLRAAAKSAAGKMPSFRPVMMGDQMLEKIVGRTPKLPWILCPRLIPGATAIYRLSWPAYRQDGRAAYVICGMFSEWKGSIVTCAVEKDASGRWRLGRLSMWDLLLWGPGWPEGSDGRMFIDD